MLRTRLAWMLCTSALLAGVAAPAAEATTVTLGPTSLVSGSGASAGCAPLAGCMSGTVVNEVVPGALDAAPANGVITGWRVQAKASNANSLALVVLGDPTGTGYTSRALSSPVNGSQGSVGGGLNPTSLPVRAGDRIGLTMIPSGQDVSVVAVDDSASRHRFFDPAFTGPNQTHTSSNTYNRVVQYNADLVLAPQVASVSPASGPAAGANEVILTGQGLDGATQVSFGATPASSFAVDSPAQIRATAPPGAAGSTVDVTVTGPGGTSDASSATKYSYLAVAAAPDGTPPKLVAFVLSPTSFLAANFGGSIAVAKPVGGRVSYRLDEAATTTFTVKRASRGYRVGKRCVRKRPASGSPRRCTRLTAVRGSFAHADVAGVNRFRFLGRLNRKSLRPGRYRLVSTPRDLAGNRGKAVSRAFRILRP